MSAGAIAVLLLGSFVLQLVAGIAVMALAPHVQIAFADWLEARRLARFRRRMQRAPAADFSVDPAAFRRDFTEQG